MYKVVDQPHQDIPVYIVRSKDGTEKKLHRNHIFHVGSSSGQCDKQEKPVPVQKRDQCHSPGGGNRRSRRNQWVRKTEKGTVDEIQCKSSELEDDDVVYRTVIERPASRSLRSRERQPPEERRQISDRADETGRKRVQEASQKTPTFAADSDRGKSEERDQRERDQTETGPPVPLSRRSGRERRI